MDYAIYKTVDGKFPHAVHRFTQDKCNHRAKRAAQAKLNDMWLRLLQHPALVRNANGTKDEFSYDHVLDAFSFYYQHIRFYIAPIK